MTTPNELALYVRAAAEQRRTLIPRRSDRRHTAQGGTVLHAVDTNVVMLYTTPWKTAPSTPLGKRGYAEIFPGEDQDLVIGLGTALADFIFHRLSANLPLVILPPMGEELNRVFTAVATEAEREDDRALEHLDKLRHLVREAGSLADPSKAAKRLAAHAAEIVHFLGGQKGSVAVLRRFTQLLRRTRMVPPEYLVERGMIQHPLLRGALEPPTDLVDRFRFRELRDKWLDRLRKTKNPQIYSVHSVHTDSDAQVLARLEWINTKLGATRDKVAPTPHRMVLITGDHAMYAAAQNVRWMNTDSNFAQYFLRHPKAYLAEPGVLDPPKDVTHDSKAAVTDAQIDQLLDIWLSPCSPGTDDFERNIDDLLRMNDEQLTAWVAPLASARPKIVNEFRRSWSDYTRSLVLDRKPSEFELQLANTAKRDVIEEYQNLIVELQEAIYERIRATWDECFNAVANGGYILSRSRSQADDPTISRNPPLLVFDRFKATNAFVNDVLKNYETGSLGAERWNKAIRKIEREDDESGYAFYLALGLLFAAEGIWRVAAILAHRALVIADRVTSPAISGREAAYLQAVALRHSAKRAADLEPISALLERAQIGYKRDLDGYPGLKAGPCRFKAEQLALFLNYHLYRVFLGNSIPEAIPSLAEIQTLIDRALGDLSSSNELEKVIRYTERSLLVNWCMTALTRLKSDGESPDVAIFRARWEALERNLAESDEEFRPTYYVEAIRRVVAWFHAQGPAAKKARRKDAVQWLNPGAVDKHSIMRYDKERFAFFSSLVQVQSRA